MVNRCAVTTVAKQPFKDWLASLPDPLEATLEQINHDNHLTHSRRQESYETTTTDLFQNRQ